MKVHLMTPMTWSAALVPLLDDETHELIVHEPGLRSVGGPCAAPHEAAIYIVHVDEKNAADVAGWWDALRSSGSSAHGESLLVVVGVGGLRYEWQLRELGAVTVVGHVWHAPRVAAVVKRQWKRLPPRETRWPAWIQTRLVDVETKFQENR